MKLPHIALSMVLMLGCGSALADVEVLGLFKGAALIKVDGEQKLLKSGQTFRNVTLVEADSREAVADIDGQRMVLKVSTRITSNYTEPTHREVRIPDNGRHQYITNAEINGRRVQVLVDTGANVVAMNSGAARAMGVDYESGTPHKVGTASGIVNAWSVSLASVNVGGIEVNHVTASVLEGNYPETVLLGMTYLKHVELNEKDGILSLTSRF